MTKEEMKSMENAGLMNVPKQTPTVFSTNNVSLRGITKQHSRISDASTPKAYVKKKMGMDYVEIGYMKALADKEFPGWSWVIKKSEALGSNYVVHGSLIWYDNGVMRTGDMVAAHRIQTKSGDSSSFVDVGNDIKSANTDCMKKALNMYMNIADDIYRNQYEDPELTDKQKQTIRILADEISEAKLIEMDTLIEESRINALNYKGVIAKLKRLKEAQE
tara:strand:+ start:36669 stop:37322 length:654 start_codon:yes stop_codon:yes gene_type:complete